MNRPVNGARMEASWGVQITSMRQIVTDVSGVILFKNRSVLYTVSTEAIISCPMKFSAYPLDHQECKFHVGSYIHDASQIYFTGTYGHDVANQRAQQYEINITALDLEDKMVKWANRDYSQTGFKIKLNRRRTPVLLQTYLPSGLFVVVSWISFIVPPEVVPGRMALLVTLFLVLVNIFNSVTANAPKSEGLTAVETWVVMCILHVFAVLAEYACILKIIQSERTQSTKRCIKLSKMKKRTIKESAGALENNKGNNRGHPHRTTYRIHHASSSGSVNLGSAPGNAPFLEQVFETPEVGKGLLFCNNNSGSSSVVTCRHITNNKFCHNSEGEDEGVGGGLNHSKRSSSFDDSMSKGGGGGGSGNSSSTDTSEPTGGGFLAVRSKVRHRYEKIDRMALYLFPFFFFIFNFCYWSYYLLFYEIFQELWK
nr:glycine receptor subunit alpha-2-like isoform X2 [Lepeophtheirus salmonis]